MKGKVFLCCLILLLGILGGSVMAQDTTKEHPNITLIKKYYAAYAQGDLKKLGSFFSSDIVWRIQGHHPLAGNGRGAVRIAAKSYRGDCSCTLLHDDRKENHDPAPVHEKDQEDTAEGAWHSSTAYEGGQRC
jgi:ketosteroid isomerase-like protein